MGWPHSHEGSDDICTCDGPCPHCAALAEALREFMEDFAAGGSTVQKQKSYYDLLAAHDASRAAPVCDCIPENAQLRWEHVESCPMYARGAARPSKTRPARPGT